jgi:uncharacterized protein (TIGR00255 family)
VLLSMTGYGDAHWQSDAASVAIELRAVNNRYLKVTLRAPEPYNLLEAEFEKVVRKTVRRGTLQVHLRYDRQDAAPDFRVNTVALRSYLKEVRALGSELGLTPTDAWLGSLLALPGVVAEPGQAGLNLDADWPVIEKVLTQALAKLHTMRQEEGRAMGQELLAYRDQIAGELAKIRERSPGVVAAYRDRLHERVSKLLAEHGVTLDRSELIKEVAVFAERSDIAEEVTRLASHLDQFQEIMAEPESPGRKLEFLTQEMFRETNTIGSKASDVEISRHVVEIKGTLEKIRELVQNVE